MQVKIGWDSRDLTVALNSTTMSLFPKAIAECLNDTAFHARSSIRKRMPEIFDKPVAFTRSAILVRKAAPSKQVAEVYIRDDAHKSIPPSKYLLPQIRGGVRRPKGMERALQRSGLLRGNEYLIPTDLTPLDRYGNLKGGLAMHVISALKSSTDAHQNSPTDKGYFFGTILGQRGIWKRVTHSTGRRGVLPFMLATRLPKQYTPRFPFFEMVEEVASRHMGAPFAKRLDEAFKRALAKRRGP